MYSYQTSKFLRHYCCYISQLSCISLAALQHLLMQNIYVISTSINQITQNYSYQNTSFSDVVGCFSMPHKNSPLQRVPEDPRLLNTKFYLFTRKNTTHPEVLLYDDEGKSLRESNFNVFKPLKVLIHGYTSKWNEKGALTVKDSYLKLVSLTLLIFN